MADVTVRNATVEVRSCKVTKSLLKQVRKGKYNDARHMIAEGKFKDEHTVGWIHGSVLGEEFAKYLLVQDGPDLLLFELGMNDYKKYKQLYIA